MTPWGALGELSSMAADGAWPREEGRSRTGGSPPAAVDQIRGALGGVERRLASPGAPPLRPEAAAALADSLQALARRIAQQEAAQDDRYEALGATLATLAHRLDAQAVQQAALAARIAESDARIAARLEQMLRERVAPSPEPRLLRGLLAVGGAAAALCVLAAATLLFLGPPRPGAVESANGAVTVSLAPHAPPSPPQPLGFALRPSLRPATSTTLPSAPAPTPQTATPPSPARTESEAAYRAVAQALDRNDVSALPRLTALAQGGEVQAQMHLAALYETGALGVKRDLLQARFWTRKAAEAGDRVAMHNLGLYLTDLGGSRNDAEAVRWFRRAAERGVVDSQFNLGMLYEAGRGVEKNLREAYRWFSVAANAGDAAAREKQVALEERLRPGERVGVDRTVQAFEPGAATTAQDLTQVVPPAETLAETQALLARKGYYVGPVDGVATPALKTAIAAYVRDNPQAVAGPQTVAR